MPQVWLQGALWLEAGLRTALRAAAGTMWAPEGAGGCLLAACITPLKDTSSQPGAIAHIYHTRCVLYVAHAVASTTARHSDSAGVHGTFKKVRGCFSNRYDT